MALKKGSAAAKAFMANLRAARGKKKIAGKKPIFVLSPEEQQFVKEESANSKGFTYRWKILRGEDIVLKEKNGAPVQKFYVDDIDVGKKIAELLNRAAKKRSTSAESKKVGNNAQGYKVVGKKNKQLVEISKYPMSKMDAIKFIEKEGIENYYTNVEIIPYRGSKPIVKINGSVKNTPVQKMHKDTKSHNVNIRVVSGVYANASDIKSSKKMYVRIDELGYIKTNDNKMQAYLKSNANKYVEVETDFLFDDQYNTIDGYRIYDTMINAVKNDARQGIKQFEESDHCAFLIWKGIKPSPLPFNDITDKLSKRNKLFDKSYDIGTYRFETNFLKHYRLENSRQRITFLYFNDLYFIANGIGYKVRKSLSGGYPISYVIPDAVKSKVNKILKSL